MPRKPPPGSMLLRRRFSVTSIRRSFGGTARLMVFKLVMAASKTWRRLKGETSCRKHDFKIPELGKVAPYGVYAIAANHGWVSVGIAADTGAFAVESIRRWWHKLGQARYPDAAGLTITADCGGSNGPQDRASPVHLHHHELAWQTTGQLSGHCPTDRLYNHRGRPQGML